MTFAPFVGKNEIQVTICFGHVHDIVGGKESFWEHFQIAVNTGCSNAISVTLNENIVLFSHDIYSKAGNTFGLIILQAVYLQM